MGKNKRKRKGERMDTKQLDEIIDAEACIAATMTTKGCILKVTPIPSNASADSISLHFEDFGELSDVKVFPQSASNSTAYALVTFEDKSAASKAAGKLSKTYLFPEIRGRRTRVFRVTGSGKEAGTAALDSDDELIEMSRNSKKQKSDPQDVNFRNIGQKRHKSSRLESPEAYDKAAMEKINISDPKSLSRLLYPNPVCLLSVAPNDVKANVMVCSWLTPVNNYGIFLMSINRRRHTASLLQKRENAKFVLSIPTAKMMEKVLKIGKFSGSKGDKFKELEIETCQPGWEIPKQSRKGSKKSDHTSNPGLSFGGGRGANPFAALATSKPAPSKEMKNESNVDRSVRRAVEYLSSPDFKLIAVKDCVAHLECHVERMVAGLIDQTHWLIKGKIDQAWVRGSHWCGRNFRPRANRPGNSLLTFLGSQKFGQLCAEDIVIEEEVKSNKADESKGK